METMIDPDALIHITDENDTEVLVAEKTVPIDDMIAVESYTKYEASERIVDRDFFNKYDDEEFYIGYDSRGIGIVIPQPIIAEIEHRE
jgi:hypothetical protein